VPNQLRSAFKVACEASTGFLSVRDHFNFVACNSLFLESKSQNVGVPDRVRCFFGGHALLYVVPKKRFVFVFGKRASQLVLTHHEYLSSR
jgi:hypothetical protein